MDLKAILEGGAIVAGLFTLASKLIDVYSARAKTKSETMVNIAAVSEKLAQGGKVAVEAATDLLGAYDKFLDKQQTEIDSQGAEIKELKTALADMEIARAERAKQIKELEGKIEDDAQETQNLRNEVTLLRKQVAEGNARYKDLEKKYANSKSAIDLLIQALKDADVLIPPALETLLGDSIHGLKWKQE